MAPPDHCSIRVIHVGGATTNSGVRVILALMEFAMKQWASTLSMLLRASSSSVRPPVAEGAHATLYSFGHFLRSGPLIVAGHTSRGEPRWNVPAAAATKR